MRQIGVLFTRSVRLPWFFAAAVALGAQVVFSLLTKAEIGALDGENQQGS